MERQADSTGDPRFLPPSAPDLHGVARRDGQLAASSAAKWRVPRPSRGLFVAPAGLHAPRARRWGRRSFGRGCHGRMATLRCPATPRVPARRSDLGAKHSGNWPRTSRPSGRAPPLHRSLPTGARTKWPGQLAAETTANGQAPPDGHPTGLRRPNSWRSTTPTGRGRDGQRAEDAAAPTPGPRRVSHLAGTPPPTGRRSRGQVAIDRPAHGKPQSGPGDGLVPVGCACRGHRTLRPPGRRSARATPGRRAERTRRDRWGRAGGGT